MKISDRIAGLFTMLILGGCNLDKSVDGSLPANQRTEIRYEALGTKDNQASIQDTLKLVVHFKNPTRRIKTLLWRIGGPEAVTRKTSPDVQEGADTLVFVPQREFITTVNLTLTDEAGAKGKFSAPLEVTYDKPLAIAGNDTTVIFGDTLILQGQARNDFGRIVKWEWDFGGTGDFVEAANGKVSMGPAPYHADSIRFVLRVTDDDGFVALDDVFVRFVPYKYLTQDSLEMDDMSLGFVDNRLLAWTTYTELGGNACAAEFDFTRHAWGGKSCLSLPETYYLRSAVVGGKLLRFMQSSNTATKLAAEYAASSGRWSQSPGINVNFQWQLTVAIPAQDLAYIVVQPDNDQNLVYDPSTSSWSELKQMPFKLDKENYAVGASLGRKLYLLGSREGPQDSIYLVEYDPDADSWTQKKSMPGVFQNSRMFGSGQKLYVFDEKNTYLLIYDAMNDIWSDGEPMPLQWRAETQDVFQVEDGVVFHKWSRHFLTWVLGMYRFSDGKWIQFEGLPYGWNNLFALTSRGGKIYMVSKDKKLLEYRPPM